MFPKKIYEKVGKKLNIPPSQIKDIYELYCQCIKDKIISLNIDISNKETFKNTNLSFSFYGLGKLYLNKKQLNIIYETQYKKDKTNE